MGPQWTFRGTEITDVNQFPEGVIGFVYQITDHTNDKIYIGRKSLYSTRKKHFGKKKLAGITDKRIKTYEMITKVMPKWQSYTGSCKPLNEKIAEGAMYTKDILAFCYSKQELSYYELKYQMVAGVIEPGNAAYNENILGKFYPKLFVHDSN